MQKVWSHLIRMPRMGDTYYWMRGRVGWSILCGGWRPARIRWKLGCRLWCYLATTADLSWFGRHCSLQRHQRRTSGFAPASFILHALWKTTSVTLTVDGVVRTWSYRMSSAGFRFWQRRTPTPTCSFCSSIGMRYQLHAGFDFFFQLVDATSAAHYWIDLGTMTVGSSTMGVKKYLHVP